MIDIDIQQELQFELIENEKLVWTGRPHGGIVLRATDIFLIPFSLIWVGFLLFALVGFGSGAMPPIMLLFFLPFIIAGSYITVGRFFLDSKIRANTGYGITDNRVIIRSGIFSKKVKSLNIKTMSDISISEKPDGSGTITLGPSDFRFTMMQGVAWPGNTQVPRLELINDVKSVYNLLLKIQRG
ncbi:MAG TPA: PH domain-containing protein [Mucilaginibacter sp.]|nr:PH domain-containing protein [Mucilaginibacter sp.]